jgi:starch phosphorylase
MKLALNGALTIGTMDGANVEIHSEVGDENIFIFGHTVEELDALRQKGYHPRDYYEANSELRRVIDMLGSGYFSPSEPARYQTIVENLLVSDPYMLLADYGAYIAAQERVDALFLDQEQWNRKAILNVSQLGHFSSDRTIREYAKQIWGIQPVPHSR